MDSLTQLTFGAAIGGAVLGPKVGKKAIAWGAILGTLPDLDVLIPMGGPVDDFVYHRGFSHSIFLLALLAPLFAWLITRIHPATRSHFRGWLLLSFLVLEASVLLDYLTIYGTQILWPFDTTPLAWPAFFIIDPLFTLPILIGILAALLLKNTSPVGHRLNRIGLVLSLVYVTWALGAKAYVDTQVREKLARQNVPYERLIASPAPFNTLLWRVVGIESDRYFETYYSLFDGEVPLTVRHYPRHIDLMQAVEDHPPVVKLRHFTRGYFALDRVEEQIVMTDLRMGAEPDYVFRFAVAHVSNPHPIPMEARQLETQQDLRRLAWIWQRIWGPLPLTMPP